MGFRFNPFTCNFDVVDFPANGVVSSGGSSTDNAIVRWDGTTGVIIQNSSATIDDSGNVTATSFTGIGTGLTGVEKTANKAVANGYASLDSSGHVPVAQLPASVMEYQGVWNATTNTPTLADGSGSTGDVYRVSVGGTQNLGSGALTFVVGDWAVYNGSIWQLSHGGADSVQSVNSSTGTVTVNAINQLTGDVTAGPASGSASAVATIANLAVTNAKIANSTIDLTAKVTGVLPVANGGTNSSTSLNNNRVMQSSSGSIVEAAAITASRALVSDSNGIPTHTSVTTTELGYMSGVTSAVQTQLNGMLQLAGRSGGQTAAGGTANSENLVLRSTTGSTKGSVVIGDQTGEKTRKGPTGSTTTYLNTHHVLVPNGSSVANSFTIQENSRDWSNTNLAAGAAGFSFIPHDAGGSAVINIRGQNAQSYLNHKNWVDGSSQGYMSMGNPWGFMNNGTTIVAAKISGTSGQTADLLQLSNQSDFSNIVSGVAANGQFKAPAGSASVASYGLYGTAGIGSYFPSTSTIAWSIGSAEQARLSSSGLNLGVTGTLTGKLLFSGATSGTVTVQPQDAAGTFNFNLPTTAGTSGQALLSGGGSTSPMTWATPNLASSGDINETSFTAADNQSAAANVTGLAFANGTVRSFEAQVSIVRNTTYAVYRLMGVQGASSWYMDQTYTGDVTGLTFTITTAGQVQYTSTSTGSTATVKFRARTTSV